MVVGPTKANPTFFSPFDNATLSAEADRRCITLVDLIRERLDISVAVQGPIDSLRDEVVYQAASAARRHAGEDDAELDAVRLETLILLRGLASHQQRRDAQLALERNGLAVWTGKAPA